MKKKLLGSFPPKTYSAHMSSSSNHYVSLLKLCCESQNQTQAKKLHCLILKTITHPETFLLNNLISTYSKLGNLEYAHGVFDHIPQSNLFSWNAILSIYSKQGHLSQMQQIFDLMPFRDGASWNLAILSYANYGSSTNAVGVYKLMLKDAAMNLNQITFSTMLILCLNC